VKILPLIVVKFGGSSVASIEKIKNIGERVVKLKEEGNNLVVVVSAMGDTTDDLIQLASGVGPKLAEREMDMLLSTGEQQSAALLAMTLINLGYPAVSLTGWQAGIISNDVFTKAKISKIDTGRIEREIAKGKIVVVAGFQGVTPEKDITTLGRGGSDTSAVALAASLKADKCIIFTDVEGVYTADPRVEKTARKLSQISYEEMLELASLGAVVMQPRAVELAMLHNIRIEVRSSYNSSPGTIIMEVGNMEQQRIVTGVAHDKNCAKFAIYDVPDKPGIAAALFKTLADHRINIDVVIQSAMRNGRNDIAFTVEASELPRAIQIVEQLVNTIGASGMSYGDKVAKVSIVGAGMQSNTGVAAAMFEALAEENINIQMISTSEIKVSCIIDEDLIEKAVRALHRKFQLDKLV
jgi:aspartate kinase